MDFMSMPQYMREPGPCQWLSNINTSRNSAWHGTRYLDSRSLHASQEAWMFSPMNVYASLLAWSGSVLYLVSARVPERWQGRMNYTVDVVPRSGPICYMAADTPFLQEYRILLPARASAVEVDTFRSSRNQVSRALRRARAVGTRIA